MQLYEDYFSKNVELVAIRESIRLDSALGRSLVNILLVFAQMEREATGERTKEAIGHIWRQGYHFDRVPYGYETRVSAENSRYQVLIENAEEQSVLSRMRILTESGFDPSKIAALLNKEEVKPPQGKKWTMSLVYNLKRRRGWHHAKPLNQRHHSDEDCKARMAQLRAKGHTQVANILNEEGYLPLKGKKFSTVSVYKLLSCSKDREFLYPRQWCEQLIASSEKRPSYAVLAHRLTRAGHQTPRGNTHWWPAQVRQLLDGAFDAHYRLLRGRIHREVHLEVTAAIWSDAAAVGDQLIDGGKQRGLLVRGERSQ